MKGPIYLFNTRISEKSIISRGISAIHGIGYKTCQKICQDLGFSYTAKASSLTEDQIKKIAGWILENVEARSDIMQSNRAKIKELVDLRCYRGSRHSYGLPARGQRTHTNRKTQRRLSQKRYKVIARN